MGFETPAQVVMEQSSCGHNGSTGCTNDVHLHCDGTEEQSGRDPTSAVGGDASGKTQWQLDVVRTARFICWCLTQRETKTTKVTH